MAPVHVWESLAILEYLSDKLPIASLWPVDPTARAHARAVASEIHAGFVPLRRLCPMNFWRPVKKCELTPEVVANVRRIDALWTDCRTRFGAGGPFLFGSFGAADAMYAPVVSRFHTYGVEVGAGSAGLYGGRHGAAGLGRVEGRRGQGALGAAPRRARLAEGPEGLICGAFP